MTEADYTPIPTPTYDDLVDGGFRNAEMIDRLQRKIERLRAALQQIRDVCTDNAPASCNQAMALSFVRHVASEALHVPGVSPVPPRNVRDIVESLSDGERAVNAAISLERDVTLVNRLIKQAKTEPPPKELVINRGQVRTLAAHAHSILFGDKPSVEKIEEMIREGKMQMCGILVRVR